MALPALLAILALVAYPLAFATYFSFFFVPKGTPHTLSNPGFEGYWEEASALLGRSGGDPAGGGVTEAPAAKLAP